MRKLFAVLLALLTPAALFGQTHVLFTLSDFNASPTTNRSVTVQKLQPFPGNLVTYSSGASGTFYVSNATVGDYDCVILKKGTASEIAFQVTVTATNLGVIGANTNTSVRGIQSYPTSGKSAWTILSSDARYSTNASSGGSATNVYLAPGSARIAVTTNSAGNWSVDVPTGVTNDSYTSATTYADAQRVAATNATGILAITAQQTNQTQILALTAQQTNESALEAFLDLQDLQGAVTDAQVPNTITVDNSTYAQGLTNTTFGNGLSYYEVTARWTFWNGDDVLAERFIAGGSFQGNGSGITNIPVIATGFNGNLTTSDDTLQEVAQKVDDLALGAGGSATNAVTTIGTNDVNLTTAATNLNFVAGTGVSLVGSSNNSGAVKIVLSASSYTNNSTGTPGTITGQGISTNLSSLILNTPDAGTGKSSGTNTYLLNPYFGSPDDGTGQHLQLFQAYTDTAWRLGSFNWTNGGAYISNAVATSPALGDDDTSVATTEWVHDSLTNRGPINVMDYGAVGNGVVNDTAAIQSALDAVPAGGGIVYFPLSTYKVSGTLWPKFGTTMKGESTALGYGTILAAIGSDIPMIQVTNSGFQMEQLALEGAVNSAGTGISITNSVSDWKLRDSRIYTFKRGIYLDSAWIGVIDNVRVRANDFGLYANLTVNAVKVINSTFHLNTNGMYWDGRSSAAISLQGVTVEDNYSHGIIITNYHTKFSVGGSSYFEGNALADLKVIAGSGSTRVSDSLTISDSFFTNTRTNIWLVNAPNVNVQNNSVPIHTNNWTFVDADSTSTNLVYENNSIGTTSNYIRSTSATFNTNGIFRSPSIVAETGGLYGLVGSGNATNAAGSRVAYESDTIAATNATGIRAITAQQTNYSTLISMLGPLTNGLGAGSQTPWTSDINGAGKSLTNVNDLEVTNNLTLYNLTLTNLQGTGVFMSLSNGIVVKTNIPAGGAGTVTSVALTAPSGFTVSGSPITSSGTLAISTPGLVHTNGNAFVAGFSNDITVDSASAIYASNLTTARVLIYDTARGITNLGFQIQPTNGNLGALSDAAWTATATSLTTPAGGATLTIGNKAGDNLLLQGELYGKGTGLTNIPIVTSVTIPMGAFSTNNVTVTDKTPASAVTATNSGDTFYFTDAITNVVHGRFALPYDWNAGVVRVGLRAFCTGTNSLSLTNTVWFVRAAAIGNGDRPDNPTWGTAVYMTNGLTTNSWTSREGITGDLTVGNTPTIAKSILWEIGRAGAASGDTLTNSSVALEEVRIYLQLNTSTNWPTASP